MTRITPALAALAAAALALPAQAATSGTLCLQITDATGDSSFNGAPLAPASLDILSADIATGAQNLVAVLRLKSLTAEPYQATGTSYSFEFTLGGAAQKLGYAVSATGTSIATYTPAGLGSDVPAKATLDTAAATITWTVPRKSVAGLKTKGAKLTGLGVSASPAVFVESGGSSFSFVGNPADTASTSKSYTDGTKTCVKGV